MRGIISPSGGPSSECLRALAREERVLDPKLANARPRLGHDRLRSFEEAGDFLGDRGIRARVRGLLEQVRARAAASREFHVVVHALEEIDRAAHVRGARRDPRPVG